MQVLVMCALLFFMIAATGWWNPQFLSAYSMRGVLRDTAIWSLFALGQAVVIIGGGIDLSVGSLIAFIGVVSLTLLGPEYGFSVVSVLLISIVIAAAIGIVHGALICGLNLQPFLVTLCSLLILRGLARVITHDRTVSLDASTHGLLRELGAGSLGGIPIPVFLLIAILAPLGFFMHCTVYGRYLYALGSNVDAARYSGVRVNALRILSYCLCSVFAAMAALLEAGDVASVPPSNAGLAYEMYGITGAVLGGCALRGGQGSLLGVVIGMAILRLIKSVVIFFGVSTYLTFAVTGVVLLGAVIVDALIRQKSQRS
ncbi:MAG TPA: ABC transporter permease [Lacipirellulaceae bacterium]|nr:ABC transporter permease [Lacipirellulaceae bacterium]